MIVKVKFRSQWFKSNFSVVIMLTTKKVGTVFKTMTHYGCFNE